MKKRLPSERALIRKIYDYYMSRPRKEIRYEADEKDTVDLLMMRGYLRKNAFIDPDGHGFFLQHPTMHPLTAAGLEFMTESWWRRFKKNHLVEMVIDAGALAGVVLAVLKIKDILDKY